MADHIDSKTVRNLKRTRRMAWWSLVWERFWPLVLPSLCVVALFLTVSGLGLWPVFGNIAQWIVLGAFALAFLGSLYPLAKMRLPGREAADSRIELKTALPHRPVTAQSDNQADISGSDDPFADVGTRSRTVEVTSIVRLSDDTFQARWSEATFQRGTRLGERRFTGLLSVTLSPPSDAETLRTNPLGLYVHSLNWGQDLVTGE